MTVLASVRMNPAARKPHRSVLFYLLPLIVTGLQVGAVADDWTTRSVTYKTIQPEGKDLQADVFRPSDDTVRPVVVFIHGGALMMGDRKLNPRPGSLLEALLKGGYAVVS